VSIEREVSQGTDKNFFEISEEAMDVASAASEVYDGVADELARTMKSYTPAALHDHQASPGPFIFVGEGEQSRRSLVAADGEDRGMLNENQRIGDLAGAPAGDEFFLQAPDFFVVS
jgi:hypothetical protein